MGGDLALRAIELRSGDGRFAHTTSHQHPTVYSHPMHTSMQVGYGIDAWFCQFLLEADANGYCKHEDKIVVADCVTCVNPEQALMRVQLFVEDKV